MHVALNQIRKVVNDIIKNHGKPAQIYVELARELKQTKQQKKQTEKQQKANEEENKEAKQILAKNNTPDNYENRLRYKLWKELDFKDVNNRQCPYSGKKISIEKLLSADRQCPYSGKTISIEKLFSAEFEIEHILPFSQTLDDSIANKTISSKSANAFKGNRSPFEAFTSSASYNYLEILQRTKTMPKHKRWRFEPEAMKKFADQNSFLASQLNDTRYISRVAKQYLQQICPKDNIKIGNGKVTALLRHNWGLNSVLNKPDFDPETGEVFSNESSNKQNSDDQNSNKQNSGKKNRQDHRHHAIDAVCIALTDQKLLQKISGDNAKNFDINKLEIQLPNHWNSFRQDVKETIDKIIVSHKIDHNKNVKLHDENNYGKLNKPVLVYNDNKKPAKCNLVIRKKLTDPKKPLKKSDVYYVRDNKIKDLLLIEAGKANSDKEFQEKILPEFSKITGIKSVRLYNNNKSVLEISHPIKTQKFTKIIKTNGNHHISLWKMPNSKYITDVVSNFKANCPYQVLTREDGFQYINYHKKFSQEQELEKLKPHPAAKLIIKLFKGDLVRIEEDGKIKTVVVKIIGSTSQCVYFPHNITQGKEENNNQDKTKGSFRLNIKALKSKKLRKLYKTNGSFCLNLKALKSKKLRKLFVSPSGKVFDNGPIFKE